MYHHEWVIVTCARVLFVQWFQCDDCPPLFPALSLCLIKFLLIRESFFPFFSFFPFWNCSFDCSKVLQIFSIHNKKKSIVLSIRWLRIIILIALFYFVFRRKFSFSQLLSARICVIAWCSCSNRKESILKKEKKNKKNCKTDKKKATMMIERREKICVIALKLFIT